MKKVSYALLALAVLAAFAACSKKSSTGAVRWAYWGSETRVKISQQAIDLYQQQNPGVLINPELSGGTGDHFTKVDTQLAAGNAPDIIQMGGNILDYVNRGILLDLTPFRGKELDTDAIDQAAVDSGIFNGKLYGVSTGVTMPTLVYNKTLLEKVGAPLPQPSMTYDEFRAYLVALKAKLPAGVYPMQDIGALPSNSTPFGYWTRYNGTPLYDDVNNRTLVTAEAAQKYLELFKDYRDNGLIPPPAEAAAFAETSADSSSVIAGKTAISFLWLTTLPGFQGATQDELGLIEMPGAAANKALWQAPSQYYTVNAKSKDPAAAVKFINFLVNSPDAAKIIGNDRGASASKTARTAIQAAASPVDQKIYSYLEVAGPHASPETPHVPNDTELNSTLFLIYQGVAFGQKTPAAGGQEIVDMLNRIIKK